MLSRSRRHVAAVASACFLALPALGQEVQAKYKDWVVYTLEEAGDTVCYAGTEAEDKAPKDVDHGGVFFFVSNSSSGNRQSQPSLMVGFPLRPELAPTARISRKTWTLYSAGNEAFALDADDPDIVRALKRGLELRVEAVSERGTAVTYHFSLSGSSAAIDRAAALCR
jgi:hypothetical protein